MKKTILIFIILFSILSCKKTAVEKKISTIVEKESETKKITESIESEIIVDKQKIDDELKFDRKVSEDDDDLNILTIDFKNYKLAINGYTSYDTKFEIKNDTLNINESLGFNLEERLLEIIPNNKSDVFEVYIANEQNLTVYIGEKQFQELKGWKKIEQYKKLNDSLDIYYKTPSYNRQSKEKKIHLDFEKIKTEVLKMKGEYITEKLSQAESYNELPIEFWISRVFIKIIRTDIDGNKEEKILINNSSWGC